jgi:hypothetical protein
MLRIRTGSSLVHGLLTCASCQIKIPPISGKARLPCFVVYFCQQKAPPIGGAFLLMRSAPHGIFFRTTPSNREYGTSFRAVPGCHPYLKMPHA